MIEIEILTSPGCSKCERTKKMVTELVKKVKEDFSLTWKITDLVEHPELALKYGIMSTPAIVINGKLEFVGVPREEKLRKKIEELSNE